MEDLLKYQIGITLIKGIGPNLAKNLIAYLGSVEAVFKEKKQHLAKIPGIGEVLSNEIASQDVLHRAEKEIEFIQKNKIQTHFFTSKSYPFRLKECPDSPIMLYYKGNRNLNEGKFIGIVGTRKATEYGKDICKQMVSDFSKKLPDITIVSGLAYGIDVCAHKASCSSNLPTIGVLGHGLDRIYPGMHRSTAVKMLKNGGLLTEFMSETNPDRPNFVQRNRIIAGMCDALIVVESGKKGGALITADLANDYNRDVFAVPGRTNDGFSAGCNMLIKYNKASLAESADDIIRLMNWEVSDVKTREIQASLFEELTENDKEIISILRKNADGVNVNELAILLNKPYSKLSSKLLEMEFKGLVKCLPGGMYKVVK
ncbi:MAG: DNA-protecting protein DprA [Bacteroidales bacterium]|nr:DNA-protecting protein DprA [Bacteroidales bacterium]